MSTTFRGYECSARQAKACRYLERRGLMLCGHFGYENAIEIAESVRRARGGDELEQRLLGSARNSRGTGG